MKKRIAIGLLGFVLSFTAQAQTTHTLDGISVNSYTFDQIKPLLFPENDVTYVINFWATWCAPCIKELPYFNELQEKYESDRFQVVLVSLDFTSQIEKRLLPFLKRKPTSAQVMHLGDPDANAWINQVDPAWSGAIPATLIYNHAKGIRSFHEKEFTQDELNELVLTHYKP